MSYPPEQQAKDRDGLFETTFNESIVAFWKNKPKEFKCNHREHKPPELLHIPAGSSYRHVCPKCGKITIINGVEKLDGEGY